MSSVRLSAVNTPNEPSANTRVPTGIRASLALWSPRFLTAIRNESPFGASESENGWCVYQNPGVRKRQKKNCPGRAPSWSSRRPVMRTETTPAPSSVTSWTRRS